MRAVDIGGFQFLEIFSLIPFLVYQKLFKVFIEYLIGMERHSGSMEVITPLYVSRMLNVPLEDVEKEMKDMDL